jgi:hypothetical protein
MFYYMAFNKQIIFNVIGIIEILVCFFNFNYSFDYLIDKIIKRLTEK